MIRQADKTGVSELDLLGHLSAEVYGGICPVADVFESVCDKLLSFLSISRAGACLFLATGELLPFRSKRPSSSLPICVDKVLKALGNAAPSPSLISIEVNGTRLDTLTMSLALLGHTCCVLLLQNEAHGQEPSYLADPRVHALCSTVSNDLSLLLARRVEAYSQSIKSELLRDLMENEQLLTDEAWHTIAAAIPRFIPDWEPAKLDPPPSVELFTFDQESRTLNLKGSNRGKSGLSPTMFAVEGTVPGMLITSSQGETADYLVLGAHAHKDRYHTVDEQISASELLIAVRHRGNILGVINLEHGRNSAFSTLHVSILLDAAAFIAPFAHGILSEGQRQRNREAAFVYVLSSMLDRIASAYRHKMAQSLPLIGSAVRDLERSLGAHATADKERLEEIRRLVLQLVDNTKDVLSDLPSAVSFHPIDIGKSAQRAIGEFVSFQSKPIEFTFHADPEHRIVLASGLLQEHIYNLLQNAVDAVSLAMIEGRITRGRISLTVERLQDAVSTAPRRVVLRISDNGVGFPSGLERNMFQYGFTTKGEHGTGFGLPAAREYARSFGGDVLLESGSGGATVAMILQEYTPQYHDRLLQRLIEKGKA